MIVHFLHLKVGGLTAGDVDDRALTIVVSLLLALETLKKAVLAELSQPLLHLVHGLQFFRVMNNYGFEVQDFILLISNMVFVCFNYLLLSFICGGHDLVLLMDLIILFCM